MRCQWHWIWLNDTCVRLGPMELQDNKYALFWAIKFVAICCSSRKLIQPPSDWVKCPFHKLLLHSTHTANSSYIALLRSTDIMCLFVFLAVNCEYLENGYRSSAECGCLWIHSFITQNSYWVIPSHLALRQALIMTLHINIAFAFQSISCLWFFIKEMKLRSGIIKMGDFTQTWTLTAFISLDPAVERH